MSTSEVQAQNEGVATPLTPTNVGGTPIAKPKSNRLDRFKSKNAGKPANVDAQLGALPHSNVGGSRDYIRVHPDEENYWSAELCFVNVPIQGQKRDTLHLIDEDLAVAYLEASQVKRFRLALATKPYDNFFLVEVPSTNLDNSWNMSALETCEMAKTQWVIAASTKGEGGERYKIKTARDSDAFPVPKWPTADLYEIIEKAFKDRLIDTEDHPGLLRLLGAKQNVS